MDYSKFARIANRIIAQFGVTATLTRKSSGAYNVSTSTAAVTSSADTITVVMFPYPAKMIDGTMIHVGDMQVFHGTEGVTADPQAADNLTIGGLIYKIVNVETHKPANEAVLYELQVRK